MGGGHILMTDDPDQQRPLMTHAWVRELYARATGPDSQLETIATSHQKPLPPFATSVYIRQRMREGPCTEPPPSPSEIQEIPSQTIREEFTTLLTEKEPAPSAPCPRAPLLVIEARTLQNPNFNGSKQHAVQLLSILLPELKAAEIPFTFLTDSDLPPLEFPEWLAWSEPFTGDTWSRVSAFLHLDPLVNQKTSRELPFLLDPNIWTCAVWLDAIMGTHPTSFLNTVDGFWEYQFSLQKLHRYDDLLCISDTSLQEAAAIFPHGPDLHTVPCVVSEATPGTELPLDLSPGTYAVAMGNAFPHKNLAVAVAGFARIQAQLPQCQYLVIVGNITDAQHHHLELLGRNAGLPEGSLFFLRHIPEEEKTALLHQASALILPSYHEGFSLPVVESIQLGTPVCLSDIPAHRELLGDSGAYFAPGRPDHCAEALKHLLTHSGDVLASQSAMLSRTLRPELTRKNLVALFRKKIPEMSR